MNETRKNQEFCKHVSEDLFKMLSLLRYRLMPLLLGASRRKLLNESLLSVITPLGGPQCRPLLLGEAHYHGTFWVFQ